jgi:hypothetical protein
VAENAENNQINHILSGAFPNGNNVIIFSK